MLTIIQTEFSPILLDYDKMYEAIYNIADNAIKYSPEGGFVHIDLRLIMTI